MANVTETNRKPSADVDDLTASLISADTTLVNTLQAVDADIGQLTAALNANSQDVSNVGNLDAASLEATDSITDASGDTHTGELADRDGDDLTPNTIDFSTSITDADDNTVTSLSDPVRVTEEASTFSEANITLTNNGTKVDNGGVELGLGAVRLLDDVEDNNTTVETTGWSGWSNPSGTLSAQNSVTLSGNYTLELVSNDNNVGMEATRNSPTKIRELSALVEFTNNSGAGNNSYLFGLTNAGSRFASISFYSDGTFQNGDGSWTSNTTYKARIFNINYSPDGSEIAFYDKEVIRVSDSTVVHSASSTHYEQEADGVTFEVNTDFEDISNTGYIDDIKVGDEPRKLGDVLVEWDSGVPTDIDSWDLATFQRTLDSETVTIDVEDSNGNVLKSDISKDTDVSDIATSTDVQLRANLSRNDTANNPTVDYLARRYTR